MLGTRIAVWLEEHQKAVELAHAGRFERGANFHGMMAVIVDDGDVVDHTSDVKTAANARKICETFANQVGRNIQVKRDGGCGGSVAHVMNSRRMRQTKQAKILAFVGQAKFAAEAIELDLTDDEVGLAGSAVRNDGALDTGNDRLNVRLIDAEDCRAAERNAIDELNERVLNVFERRVLIKMLAVDGSDDGNHRGEHQKAAIAFVGFDDEVLSFAKACGRAGLIHSATYDKSRVEMGGCQDRSNHGGGGRLAMRAGDGDAIFQAHQFRQHFRSGNDRDFAAMGFNDLGIVGLHCGRGDDHVRAIGM